MNAFSPAQMKYLKIYIGKVFASVQMHLYSKYEVNSFRNKVVRAKRRQKTLLRTFKIATVRKWDFFENSHIAHVTFRSRPNTSAKTAWKSVQYFSRVKGTNKQTDRYTHTHTILYISKMIYCDMILLNVIKSYMVLACALEGLRPSMIVRAPGGFAPHDYTIDNENNTKTRIQIRW